MDNPAAVLTDDVVEWRTSPATTGQDQFHNGQAGINSAYSKGTINDVSQAQSPSTDKQQHYKRNASTYSIDIPATMGLIVTSGTNNSGSTTSSTMKLTEYSSGGSSSSNNGSVGDGALTAVYTVSGGASDAGTVANGNGTGGGRRLRKGGKKPPPYDPFEMRDAAGATTSKGALLHLIKSSLGSGILAMPNAFKNGGLIFSLFGTVAIGMLCTHCIYLLVVCSQTLARRTRRPALGFAETADAAFSTGPRRLRPWARFASEFVNASLFCTYYFGNTVYVVFVAASFQQVAESHLPLEWHLSPRAWILALAVPLVPLGIIRSMKVLVPFSAIATTCILVGLGATMSWVVYGTSPFAADGTLVPAVPLPHVTDVPWIAPVAHMPLFFATVLFAMEGIGTVLPIENSMRRPDQFLTARPCGVLNASMSLVVILYSVAGFLGYWRFGESTHGSITLDLPQDLFAETIKILVALSILFSYGLQFCVPSEIVWDRLEPWLTKRRKAGKYSMDNGSSLQCSVVVSTVTGGTATATNNTAVDEKRQLEKTSTGKKEQKPVEGMYYVMRGLMILGTVLIAALVPDLAPFISLIGAVFFSILGLMCPAVIHLATFWNHSDEDGEHADEWGDSADDSSSVGGDSYYAVSDDADLDRVRRPPQMRRGSARHGKKGMSRLAIAKDVAIVAIALIALVSGTYASLVDIVAFYNGGHHGGHAAANVTAAPAAAAFVSTTDAVIGPGPESAF